MSSQDKDTNNTKAANLSIFSKSNKQNVLGWDYVTDYMKNINDAVHDTISNVSGQCSEILYSTNPPKILDSFTANVPFLPQNSFQNVSNPTDSNSSQQNNIDSNDALENKNNSAISATTNSMRIAPQMIISEDKKNPASNHSLPRTGIFKFLPKQMLFTNPSQHRLSRTTSVDQVRSTLTFLVLTPTNDCPPLSAIQKRINQGQKSPNENFISNIEKETLLEPLSPSSLDNEDDNDHDDNKKRSNTYISKHQTNTILNEFLVSNLRSSSASSAVQSLPPPYFAGKPSSDAQAASQLAEGTILALRDMILDEAVELHESLRFWTERWERPYLSWLESGPQVWFSEGGYNHLLVGQKVSQIQAVLARRCASIGELQEHLLRAGWHKGVAQWGVLGQGDEWANVTGGNGTVDFKSNNNHNNLTKTKTKNDPRVMKRQPSMEIFPHSSIIGKYDNDPLNNYHESNEQYHRHNQQQQKQQQQQQSERLNSVYYGHSSVFVKNIRGGQIFTNDPAVASWTVDAIRVIRDQLYRAGNPNLVLPFYENWPQEASHFKIMKSTTSSSHNTTTDDEIINEEDDNDDHALFPVWAIENKKSNDFCRDIDKTPSEGEGAIITDLPTMATEVAELLNSMEVQMEVQRKRRLSQLKPPRVIVRSWYLFAVGIPAIGYVSYRLFMEKLYIDLSRHVIRKVSSFFSEHFSEPLRSIFDELVTNNKEREDITDQKARMNAMESLQKMIKDWLDDVYPKINDAERIKMATEMDISLLEKRKELSLKHALFEIQDIVRMSIIEMQFIKKELMNAMSAIDELMNSNEINFRLGAILPTFMVLYGAKRMFDYLRYALLKLGKSREQIHTTIRQILLDIERLLVVRDDPPSAPAPLIRGTEIQNGPDMEEIKDMTNDVQHQTTNNMFVRKKTVLNSDDLGMLMLLVHELRSIIWKNRRRFSEETIRNITEDLSELSGERGAISIKQQLQIISRMYRTYSFLKVVSTAIPLESRRFV